MKQLTETHIKGQIRDFLAAMQIFSYPIMQGLGCYPGLPDRVIHFNGRVIYLEVKTTKGKLSDHQIAFQEQCEQDGIKYRVIRDLEGLQEVLNETYSDKTH